MSVSTGDPVLARALYNKGYYLLSALEWSRVAVGTKDQDKAAEANLEMAYAFWKVNDADASYRIVDSLAGQTNLPPSIRSHALALKAAMALSAGDFDRCADAAGEALRQYPKDTEPIARDLKKCVVARNIVHFERREAASVMRESDLAPSDLLADVEAQDVPWKSPILSGTLSAVIPGAGQTYCGRWREGLAAFSVNAVLAGSAYECFDKDLPMLGSAVIVAGLTWYVGNIYNAANVAHKRNDETLAMMVTDWLKRLEIGLDEKSMRVGFGFSF